MPNYIPAILPNGLTKNVVVYPKTGNATYNLRNHNISGSLIGDYFVPKTPNDAIALRDWTPSPNYFKKKSTSTKANKETIIMPTITKPKTTITGVRIKAQKPKPETFYERIQEMNSNPVYIEFPDGTSLKFRYTSPIDKDRGIIESSIDGRQVDIRGYMTETGFVPDSDRMKDYRLLYKKKSQQRAYA